MRSALWRRYKLGISLSTCVKQNKRISMEMYQWDIMLIELTGEEMFIIM
jgi:hypothetical protein